QVRAAANLTRTNMSATTVQRGITRNVTRVDMPTRSERGQVSCHVEHFDVPARRFEFGDWPAARAFAHAGPADVPGNNEAALRSQISCAADVTGGDIAGVGADFNAVIVRDSHLELHPNLRVSGA